MSNIQEQIQAAASRFATEVVSLLKGATLSEITSLTGRGSGASDSTRAARARTQAPQLKSPPDKQKRRGRSAGKKRSREEVTRLAEKVVDFLKGQKEEVGVSAIADALHVPTGDLGLPLSKLRSENRIKTRGQKRSTVYRLA